MPKKTVLGLLMALLAADVNAAANVNLNAAGADGKIALSWTVTGNIANIQVMRDTDANPSGRRRLAILGGSDLGYTDSTAENGRRYWYWIKFTDVDRKVGNSNAASATAGSSRGTPPVAVSSVTVTPTSTSVKVGSSTSLSASVMPATATNKNIRWKSGNPSVATVSASGVVTGVSPGSASITVTTADGARTASSTVWVSASSSTTGPLGDAFGFGRSVTGGAGGSTVRVSTMDQLRQALCNTTSGGYCTDTTSRIIEVASTIDFTDTEGSAQVTGCYATQICSAPAKTEITVLTNPSYTHCNGKNQFDVSYKKAALRGLLVGSNKTLVGVGQDGVIKGKGLLLMGGVKNIIIRNLSFTDIAQGLVFGGDGITVSDASRVWIDHNYFARIGRQMIVTGTGDKSGKVTDMTISWNEFDGRNDYSPYCNGKHYWNLLFYGKGNVTFANNWLHDFSGRAPQIGGDTTVHMLSNYFSNGSWYALSTLDNTVRVLAEGNDFENVSVPILNDSNSGDVYALLAQTPAAESACQSAIGRGCVPNKLTSAANVDGFTQDSAVLDAAMSAPAGTIVTPAEADNVKKAIQARAGVGKN